MTGQADDATIEAIRELLSEDAGFDPGGVIGVGRFDDLARRIAGLLAGVRTERSEAEIKAEAWDEGVVAALRSPLTLFALKRVNPHRPDFCPHSIGRASQCQMCIDRAARADRAAQGTDTEGGV